MDTVICRLGVIDRETEVMVPLRPAEDREPPASLQADLEMLCPTGAPAGLAAAGSLPSLHLWVRTFASFFFFFFHISNACFLKTWSALKENWFVSKLGRDRNTSHT